MIIAFGVLVGGLVGPSLAGLAADRWGMGAPLQLLMGCAVLSAVLSLALRETAPGRESAVTFSSRLRCLMVAVIAALAGCAGKDATTTVTVATVNNGDMITLKKLAAEFERLNPEHSSQMGGARRERAAATSDHRRCDRRGAVRRRDHRQLRGAALGQTELAQIIC